MAKKEEKDIQGVEELISDIKTNLTQKSASNRDETRVMRAMLNDRNFKVTQYSNSGTTQHCPAEDYRKMLTNVVSSTTKISSSEASTLVDNYDVKKSDAEIMVGLSKDFIHCALSTGRKVSFGGTEKGNISIQLREVPESVKRYPKKLSDGSYEKGETRIPAHDTLKVTAPCPSWAGKKTK